ASIAANLLAGGMSSRLFQKLREEMGVCYYVNAWNDASTDHGYFQISAGVDNKRLGEVVEVIQNELKRLSLDVVPNDELGKVKAFMIGNFKMSLESTDTVAEFFGIQDILGKEIKSPVEVINQIEAVTPNDIKEFARAFFLPEKANLAVVGPSTNPSSFEKLLGM
ncbi:MAG TPA: insulinase family protein, partial [Blastocatellia bacterium]|nr:insulinase family protein [Blastocatellia bacterium]